MIHVPTPGIAMAGRVNSHLYRMKHHVYDLLFWHIMGTELNGFCATMWTTRHENWAPSERALYGSYTAIYHKNTLSCPQHRYITTLLKRSKMETKTENRRTPVHLPRDTQNDMRSNDQTLDTHPVQPIQVEHLATACKIISRTKTSTTTRPRRWQILMMAPPLYVPSSAAGWCRTLDP